jgi:hypothetical protein
MANVFVSHRLADASSARRLATDLKAAGHDVWLDEWNIRVGDSIVERIDSGLSGASYLVLCLSKEGVASPWTTREWMSALFRQLEGYGVRVLPARLSTGPVPAILADLRPANLETDWRSGVHDLLTAMEAR